MFLRIAGGWPAECTIVPFGDDVALVMPSEDFGTVLRRDGDRLRWTRADGLAVTFTRGQ